MSSEQKKRRIAITGIGLFSPIGIGPEEFLENLNAGRSGIAKSTTPGIATPGEIGGEVRGFTEETAKKDYLKSQRKSLKVMCREIQLGTAAALQAVENAGLKIEEIGHDRVGVEYGANLMFFNPESMAHPADACRDETGSFAFTKWGREGLGSMEPLWMLKYLPNMPACHIAIFTDARGPNNSVTLDDASPGVALTEALNILERGSADAMLVGGTGTRIHPVRAVHARLYDDLGYDELDPSASCRPFDENRTGQVVSEGAACFVLEDAEKAQARGAQIYGYLTGGGSSCVATPQGEANITQAVLNASRVALRRAGVEVSQLGHVNAHGAGTQEGDQMEAVALRQLLDGATNQVAVTGLKGYFGNAGASTGFFEIAASLLSLQNERIPLTLNCLHPDASLGLKIANEPLPASNKRFLKVNYTRAGQASAVVIECV